MKGYFDDAVVEEMVRLYRRDNEPMIETLRRLHELSEQAEKEKKESENSLATI